MATWEDGPEYAPSARPDGFSSVEAPALEVPPATEQSAAQAPKDRPQFDAPQAAVAPLTALVPVVADERDPQLPFAVVSSTLTSMDSAWGAAHWNATNGAPGTTHPDWPEPAVPQVIGANPATTPGASGYAGTPWGSPPPPPANGVWGSPSVSPWPEPVAPTPPVNGPAALPGGYPAPGTPQWFGPGPMPLPQQPVPSPTGARAVLDAATPGMCICLALGGFLYFLAPITLGLAFVLSKRVQVAQEQVRRIFLLALGFLGLMALAGMILNQVWLVDWWSFVGKWSLFLSWVVLASVLVAVHLQLKSGRPGPPPSHYPPSWG